MHGLDIGFLRYWFAWSNGTVSVACSKEVLQLWPAVTRITVYLVSISVYWKPCTHTVVPGFAVHEKRICGACSSKS